MSKTTSFAAAVVAAALVSIPAASQARDCSRLDRVGTGAATVVKETGRAMARIGDRIVRAGDRMFSRVFADRHRD